MNRLSLTYALLGHYKEKCNKADKSIWEIYLPMVKKALHTYFEEQSTLEVKGCALTELQQKINDIFEISFPIPVLHECMLLLQDEINDSSKFVVYKDHAFDIKASAVESVDSLIKETQQELSILEDDFDTFCKVYDKSCDFDLLLNFINTMQIEMFTEETINLQEVNNIIPLYISKRKNDKEIFKIISNVYTGSLLSSYLIHKINSQVAKVELLIDTNYFISLIDLNTEDAHTTCQDLQRYCKDMGFNMTILPSTVEQIKILLSNRIADFALKDYLGTIKTADVFAACKRRQLDQTHLETIRNKVEELLTNYDITILKEAQIAQIVDRAKKSDVYKVLKEKRGNTDSALNDAIAIEYVNTKRGNNCTNFSDVKCWFLHNSYGNFYRDPGASAVKRTSIGAPELLTMLWMANPAQVDSTKLSRVGLTAYVTKYMEQHLPSDNTLLAIQRRALVAQEAGEINDKDFYSLCTRMSEGTLSQDELNSLEKMSNEEFSIYLAQIVAAQNNLMEKAQQAIRADKEQQEKKKRYGELIQQKKQLIETQQENERKIATMEDERNKSFKNWQPIFWWIIASITLIMGFILFYLQDITHVFKSYKMLIKAILYIIPFVFTGSVAIAIFRTNSTEKRRADFNNKWENEPQNSDYRRLLRENENIKTQLQTIDEQINSLMS